MNGVAMEGKARLKIGVDLDNTLADTIPAWTKLLGEKHGIKIDLSEIKEYDLIYHVPMTNEEIQDTFRVVWADHKNVPLNPGDPQTVLKNISNDHDLFIVTATVAKKGEVDQWLERNGIKHKGLVMVRSSEKLNSGVDLIIDDNPKVIDLFSKAGKMAIIYDRPWNRGIKEGDKVVRVKDWSELPKALYKLLGKVS
jgi:5'(3')-deoxyribonucleotidase